jgi:ABC-2 type transport system permease protein
MQKGMIIMDCIQNTKAILKRELKSYFESPVAYVFLVVFLMLSAFMTFAVGRFYENGQADLRGFFFWHPWVYLILVPAASMRLWAEERRAGTIELLLTMPVTLAQAILGKFLAAWLFLAIALVLTLPVLLTTMYLGDPDLGVALTGYIGSFLLAGTYLSVGILTSAMTRNQVISFVLSVVICLFLLLAGWPPVTDLLVRAIQDRSWLEWLVHGVASFSFMPHYDAVQRGVVALRDLVYYASVMTFMLFATHLVLENRKAA